MDRAMEAVMRLVHHLTNRTCAEPHSEAAGKSVSEPVPPGPGERTKRDQILKKIEAGDFIYW